MSDGADFVGSGWTFPPRVNSRGGIALASGTEEIEGAIRMILLSAPGERLMRPEFGCEIWDYLFHPLNANTTGRMTLAVEEALARWEPRIDVQQVTVRPDLERPGSVVVDVEYVVRQTNDRRNLVVPFYEIGEEPETAP
jgi:phage baseplate assembly protein W